MLMGDIFRRASEVLAWLGKTQHSFRTVIKIAHLVATQDAYSKSTEELIRQEYFRNKEDWETLSSLFPQPWFSRVWVIQEVAVPPNVRVVYGNIVIPWDALEEFLECIASNVFLMGALGAEEKAAFMAVGERESVRGAGNATRMVSLRRRHKMHQYSHSLPKFHPT
jgi:hypothetical protein